jgi:cytochrome P450
MNPLGYLASCQRRYGDIFSFGLVAGGQLVGTSDPEAVRSIFTADADLFENGRRADSFGPLVGENSVLLADGARHRAQRKLLMPPLNGARMRSYGRLMQELTRKKAERWVPGRPFSMLQVSQEISMEIILQAVFGVTEPERMKAFRDASLAMASAYKPYLMLFKGLRHDFGGFGPWARFQRFSRRLDGLLFAEIAQRRAAGRYGEDILSVLLNAKYEDDRPLSNAELRDQLVTLLIGGHETAANTLAWAFYWLDRHPAARARLKAEIETLGNDPDSEAVARLPYLEAVCNESMRLNPPAPFVRRDLKKPFTLMGYTLPRGIAVSVWLYLVHQRKDLYPDPESFKPERFLSRTYSPFEFLPFGGGARRCPGAAFAMYEMKQVLATIVPRYQLRLTDSRPVAAGMHGASVAPMTGVEMTLVA